MISRIKGKAVAWDDEAQSVEIDINGIVYEVRLPTACWLALEDERPDDLSLYTHYHVPERPPVPVLIGFLRPVERDFFRKLISVRDMGVSKAQRALAASVSTIAQWIEAEDRRALTTLPGIGPRQADKIIAELRGKVIEEAHLIDEGFDASAQRRPRPSADVADDAVEALIGLGYPRRDAEAWVTAALIAPGFEGPATTETILRTVLENLGST